MCLIGLRRGTNLAARQTAADCIIPIAEEVGYPDTLFCADFLVGSLAQLVHLQAWRNLAGESELHNSLCPILTLCWAHGPMDLHCAGQSDVGIVNIACLVRVETNDRHHARGPGVSSRLHALATDLHQLQAILESAGQAIPLARTLRGLVLPLAIARGC